MPEALEGQAIDDIRVDSETAYSSSDLLTERAPAHCQLDVRFEPAHRCAAQTGRDLFESAHLPENDPPPDDSAIEAAVDGNNKTDSKSKLVSESAQAALFGLDAPAPEFAECLGRD